MAERNAYAASSSKSPLPRSSQSQNRYPPGGGGSFTFLSEDQDHDALQSGNFRYRRDPATTSRPSSRSSPSYNAVGGYMQGQPPLRSPKSTTTTDVAPAPRMRPRAPGLPSRPSQGIMSSGGVASAMGLAPRSDFLDREALRASLDSGLGHHDGDQGGYRPAMAWGGSERQGGSSSAAGLAPAPPVRAAWTSHGTHAMSSGRPSAAVRPSTGATPLSPPSVWGDLRGGTGTGTSRTAAFQSMEEDVPSITQGGSTRVPTASSERHARGGARRAPFTRSRPSASHGSREQWTDGSERSGVDAGAAQSTLRGSGEEVQLDREGRGTVTKKGRGARSANYLTRGAGPRGINTISLSSSVTNRGIEEESIGLEISLSDYMAALETTPAPSSATPASQELWGDLDMSVAHNGAEGPRLVIQGAADASDLELAVRGLSLRERSAASSSNGMGGISADEYYATGGSISNNRNPVSPNSAGDWGVGTSPAPRPFTSSKNRTVSPASSGKALSPRDDPLSPSGGSTARTLSPTGPPKASDGGATAAESSHAMGYGASSGAASTSANAGGATTGSGAHLARPLRSARSYGHPPSEIETGVGRPPSRQRPPPEALHLFVENQNQAAAAAPARSRPPSSTAPLQPSPRDPLEADRNSLASRQSTARLPERSPRSAEPNGRGVIQRPPSRQRPPPEALCLDMSSPWGRFQDIYIDSSGSDVGSP